MTHPNKTDRNPLKNMTLEQINLRVRDINCDYFDYTSPRGSLHPKRVQVWVVCIDEVDNVFFAPIRVVGYAGTAADFCKKRGEGMKVHGTYALNSIKEHGFIEVTRKALPSLSDKLEAWATFHNREVHEGSRFVIHPLTIAKLSDIVLEIADSYQDCTQVEQNAIKSLINTGQIDLLI